MKKFWLTQKQHFFVKPYLFDTDRDQIWVGNIRKFIVYKNLGDINLPWDFKDLMDLPLAMIETIYDQMDELIEKETEKMRNLKRNGK